MSDLVRVVADAVRTSRMFKPQMVLPVEEWVDVAGHYRFGLVWPWERLGDADDLVDARGFSTGTAVDVSVEAPRTSGLAIARAWREDGVADLEVPRRIGKVFGRLYAGRVLDERLVDLGGSRAAFVSIATRDDQVWRVMAPRPKGVVHLEMRVPLVHEGGYRPHLETMLASWRWIA